MGCVASKEAVKDVKKSGVEGKDILSKEKTVVSVNKSNVTSSLNGQELQASSIDDKTLSASKNIDSKLASTVKVVDSNVAATGSKLTSTIKSVDTKVASTDKVIDAKLGSTNLAVDNKSAAPGLGDNKLAAPGLALDSKLASTMKAVDSKVTSSQNALDAKLPSLDQKTSQSSNPESTFGVKSGVASSYTSAQDDVLKRTNAAIGTVTVPTLPTSVDGDISKDGEAPHRKLVNRISPNIESPVSLVPGAVADSQANIAGGVSGGKMLLRIEKSHLIFHLLVKCVSYQMDVPCLFPLFILT